MSSSEEVIKIGKKLDKMVSSETTDDSSANDLLGALKKFPMTFELLQKTRIGMKVNNFRKACNNDNLVSLSKSLIKNWKKLLPESSSGSQSSTTKSGSTSSLQRSNSSGSFSTPKDEDSRDSGNSDSQKPETPTSPSGKPELQRQPSCRADDTTDTIRLKCRELLANALKTAEPITNSQDPNELGAAIEDCIFKEFKDTGSKYKARVRSRVANLKDSRNPSLQENVLIGIIPADSIATMTAEEMASDDMKEMRAKFTKEAINDHQMARQSGTTTSIFKCGKCGQRNTTYNQVQTRSADEPMTTFVLCNNCGNRWKFC